jgi:hypothetical protein
MLCPHQYSESICFSFPIDLHQPFVVSLPSLRRTAQIRGAPMFLCADTDSHSGEYQDHSPIQHDIPVILLMDSIDSEESAASIFQDVTELH